MAASTAVVGALAIRIPRPDGDAATVVGIALYSLVCAVWAWMTWAASRDREQMSTGETVFVWLLVVAFVLLFVIR
jgi:hypothetical protein